MNQLQQLSRQPRPLPRDSSLDSAMIDGSRIAGPALALATWANLAELDEDDFLPVDDGGEPFVPVNANRLF